MDVLLIGNKEFKVLNCVTLSFTNSEIYSRIYVVSYHRKSFWTNILYKNILIKYPHSHNLT